MKRELGLEKRLKCSPDCSGRILISVSNFNERLNMYVVQKKCRHASQKRV